MTIYWVEFIGLFLAFLPPVGLSLAAWWAWASLLPRPRRRGWLSLVVPLLLLGAAALWARWFWGQWHIGEPWMRVYNLGLPGGIVMAGLILTAAGRGLRRLTHPGRLVVVISGIISLLAFLVVLGIFWAGGDIARQADSSGWPATLLGAPLRPESTAGLESRREWSVAYTRWVRLTIPAIYMGVLLLSGAVAYLWAFMLRVPRTWLVPAVTVAFLAAFMVATFFYPVEFINSCLARTLLPYVLC